MSSDVSAPGYPTSAPEVATTQPQPQPARERVSRVSRDEMAQTKPKRSPAPRTSTQLDFPTAKSVPDNPGYVVSPFDVSGRYVDVSGYASGSKVKDPWTDKIFIVP